MSQSTRHHQHQHHWHHQHHQQHSQMDVGDSQEAHHPGALGFATSAPENLNVGYGTQQQQQQDSTAHWMLHPAPYPHPHATTSPAFSNVSMPSPESRSVPLRITSCGAFAHARTQASAFASPYHDTQGAFTGTALTSLSTPSHKSKFNHAALYLPRMDMRAGVARRFHSATPNVPRNPEQIRRPLTSMSSEHGGVSPMRHTYHPYTLHAHSRSQASSTRSSPVGYTVPLMDYAPMNQ